MKKTYMHTTERIINKKFFGFSIAEMLLVLLVVAVILAAVSPMVTRKVSQDHYDRIFDMLNTDPQNAVEYIKGNNQRIFMNGQKDGYIGIRETGYTIPANSILFGYNNYTATDNPTNFIGLGFETENYINSIAIGYNTLGKSDSIAIGYNAKGIDTETTTELSGSDAATEFTLKSIAIGANSESGTNSVSVGYAAGTNSTSVAIGYGAKAIEPYSTAIGYNAVANKKNSTAIGYNAQTEFENTIVLGTEGDTVYIPGNIVVDHAALIGRAGTRNDNLYFLPYAQEDGRHFSVLSAGDWQGDDSNIAIVRNKNRDNKPQVIVGPYATTEFDKWYKKKTFMGITTSSRYDDNHYAKIDFETPENGDFVCISKHADRGCNSRGSGIGAEHRGVLSDMRLKDIGEAFTGGLAELDKLNIYHFTFKNDEKKTPHVGVMAQNLKEVFPDAVTENNEGYLQIRWDEMLYSAINAIKELNSKLTVIDEKLQQITQDIKNLQNITEKRQVTLEERTQLLKERQEKLEKLSARIDKLEHRKK